MVNRNSKYNYTFIKQTTKYFENIICIRKCADVWNGDEIQLYWNFFLKSTEFGILPRFYWNFRIQQHNYIVIPNDFRNFSPKPFYRCAKLARWIKCMWIESFCLMVEQKVYSFISIVQFCLFVCLSLLSRTIEWFFCWCSQYITVLNYKRDRKFWVKCIVRCTSYDVAWPVHWDILFAFMQQLDLKVNGKDSKNVCLLSSWVKFWLIVFRSTAKTLVMQRNFRLDTEYTHTHTRFG